MGISLFSPNLSSSFLDAFSTPSLAPSPGVTFSEEKEFNENFGNISRDATLYQC